MDSTSLGVISRGDIWDIMVVSADGMPLMPSTTAMLLFRSVGSL